MVDAQQEARARLNEAVRADPAARARLRRELSLVEKARLAVEIFLAYVRVRRRIHAVTLPDLLAGLRGDVRDRGIAAWEIVDEHVTAVRLSRAVVRMLRWLPGDTRCLTQSLVLTKLLARRGVGSTLLIAVAPGQEFRAHAWVEHGNVAILPADGPGYGRLAAL